MFSILPNTPWPGFRVGQPEELPGFRLANDGSLPADAESGGRTYASDGGVYPAGDRADEPLVGRPPVQDPARWSATLPGTSYAGAGDDGAGFVDRLRPFLADVRDAAERVGTRANAVVNGAYSVFPGTYNALRAVGRGIGILGPEEFRRFGQEADFIGTALGQVAEHPGPAARVSRDALSALDTDPLFRYYMLGRTAMGALTGLGPAAMAGDALRAVEKGHNMINAYKRGIQGTPSSGP